MNVKKVFVILITIVALVVLGAFVLNSLMPSVTTQMVNAVEDQIYKGTGLSFDFNKDGHSGQNNKSYDTNTDMEETAAGVDGFK